MAKEPTEHYPPESGGGPRNIYVCSWRGKLHIIRAWNSEEALRLLGPFGTESERAECGARLALVDTFGEARILIRHS